METTMTKGKNFAKGRLQGLIDARFAIAEIEGGMSERFKTAFANIRHRMHELIHAAATEANENEQSR